jgi:hypothetical protein
VGSSNEHTHSTLDAFEGEPGVVSLYGYENMTIIVWHAKPTVLAVQKLARVSQRRRAEFEHGISVVHLVPKVFEMPDPAARDAFLKVLRDGGGKLAVLCIIVASGGFWASALRSLVTGLRVLSRESFDLGLYTDIREAVDYLLPRHFAKTGVAVSPEPLASVLTKLSQTHT